MPLIVLTMGTLGAGNGAVFQIVPQRFARNVGVVTGLVGATGGVGGFYLAASLGYAKQLTGGYGVGLALFAGLSLAALVRAASVARAGAAPSSTAPRSPPPEQAPAARRGRPLPYSRRTSCAIFPRMRSTSNASSLPGRGWSSSATACRRAARWKSCLRPRPTPIR